MVCSIELTIHSIDKLQDRKFPEKTIKYILTNYKVLGLLKQDTNKFKLYYKHPSKKDYDLIIVITIPNPFEIRIITVFEQKSSRRERK